MREENKARNIRGVIILVFIRNEAPSRMQGLRLLDPEAIFKQAPWEEKFCIPVPERVQEVSGQEYGILWGLLHVIGRQALACSATPGSQHFSLLREQGVLWGRREAGHIRGSPLSIDDLPEKHVSRLGSTVTWDPWLTVPQGLLKSSTLPPLDI